MGQLISFEGIDGSGKTTVLSLVVSNLRERGYTVFALQEPGSTLIGQKIRRLLKSGTSRSKLSDAFLYEASRADMIETKVIPALAKYDFVMLDRYTDSTLAYQGAGNGVNTDILEILNKIATQNIQPDWRFLIDVPLDVAAHRRALRNDDSKEHDWFEEQTKYAKRVYDSYQQMVADGHLIAIPNDRAVIAAESITQLVTIE